MKLNDDPLNADPLGRLPDRLQLQIAGAHFNHAFILAVDILDMQKRHSPGKSFHPLKGILAGFNGKMGVQLYLDQGRIGLFRQQCQGGLTAYAFKFLRMIVVVERQAVAAADKRYFAYLLNCPRPVSGHITVERNIWTAQNIAITVAVVVAIVLFMAYARWPRKKP